MLGAREEHGALEQTRREATEEAGQPGSSVSAAMSLHETPGVGTAPVRTLPARGHADVTQQRCLSSPQRTAVALAGLLFERCLTPTPDHGHHHNQGPGAWEVKEPG